MTEVMKMSRKAFSIGVVALTVAWSIGLSALLAPLASSAATSGQLIKASLPAVYYMGSDGKRYVFPNEATYKTWYADFSSVVTITDAELASIAIGGNVTMRPGVKMVKITTDPKVYAIDAHGVLRWVTSEAVAIALYGANWNTMVLDIPDAFFTNYTVGADITSAASFSPSAVTTAASSINADKNLAVGNAAGLSVSKASDSPAGATIPMGATGVNFLKFMVTNGSSSAQTLSSVTVHRSGPGASTDFSNVYLYQGANRLTTGRSINSSSNEATFSGLNLSVPAGGVVSMWVAADMAGAGGAGNVNALGVKAVMVGGQSVAGVPIVGSSFTLATAAVQNTTIAETAGSYSAIKAGGMNQKVAEFRLTAPGNEDVDLHSIALFYSGTTNRAYVTNLVLKQGGLTLATASSISDKDLAVFDLAAPMYMEKGAQRTFEVFADLGGNARSTENVDFYVDQNSDLHVVGRTYGFGTGVTNNWASGAPSVAVEAGKFTTAFNGPAAKNVASNGKDIELYNFTVTAQSNLEVRSTELVITEGAGNGTDCTAIDDLKIVDTATGAIVAGPIDLLDGGANGACDQTADTGVIGFTETWNLNAGQTRTFKVTADIASAFTTNNTITVALGDGGDLFDATAVRNLDNSTYLTAANGDFVPSGTITGNAHTVKAATLDVTPASTPVAQTYIQGTSGASLGGFSLAAGDASDIKISSIAIQGEHDDTATGGSFVNGQDTTLNNIATIVLTAKLWNGSTQVGETESPTSSTATNTGGKITFDNLNLTVPAGQTVSLKLTGDLAGGLSNLGDAIRFEVEAAADVSATDKDGNSVTANDGDGNYGDAYVTQVGNQMRVEAEGTLSISLAPDDTESEAGLLVGGASNAVLAKYKFTASNEELKLSKVRFSVASPTGVTSLSLYDGATLVAGPVAVSGAGFADFTNTSFVVPKDASKTLTVKGNLNSVGIGGASTGAAVTVIMEDDAGYFEARGTGAGSNTLLPDISDAAAADDGDDISGNAKILRKTKPTVSLVALPSTALTNGSQVAMRFTISADAAGDVAIKRISALLVPSAAVGTTIDAEGAGANSSIRRVGDGSNLAGDSDLNGGACVGNTASCVFKAAFTNEEVIAAGTSRTYDIRITVGGTAVSSGNSIGMTLTSDTAVVSGELDGVVAAGAVEIDDLDGTPAANAEYNFIWSDVSAVPHNATVGTVDDGTGTGEATPSDDWTNGLYVKTLPSDSQTLSKS